MGGKGERGGSGKTGGRADGAGRRRGRAYGLCGCAGVRGRAIGQRKAAAAARATAANLAIHGMWLTSPQWHYCGVHSAGLEILQTLSASALSPPPRSPSLAGEPCPDTPTRTTEANATKQVRRSCGWWSRSCVRRRVLRDLWSPTTLFATLPHRCSSLPSPFSLETQLRTHTSMADIERKTSGGSEKRGRHSLEIAVQYCTLP